MPNKIKITSKNVEFLEKVKDLSGEVITLCDQCGICSGSCPMIESMDITPSQMMRMTQLGMAEVLETKAMWVCASCFTCTVRCPRGLDLSKVAEALRQIKLRDAIENVDVNKISKEDLRELPQIALIGAMRKMTS